MLAVLAVTAGALAATGSLPGALPGIAGRDAARAAPTSGTAAGARGPAAPATGGAANTGGAMNADDAAGAGGAAGAGDQGDATGTPERPGRAVTTGPAGPAGPAGQAGQGPPGGGPSSGSTRPASTVTTILDPLEQAVIEAAPGTALASVADLTVRGTEPSAGYALSRFLTTWADSDGNGCNQRDDVLRRDLEPESLRVGSGGCRVLAGTLRDPWTGRAVRFTRAGAQVGVTHVVTPADAWAKGAREWPAARRERFATDPLNLQAVGTADPGRGDAATWLPRGRVQQCRYVARQVAVKRAYGVWVTPDERAAMARVLAGCPDRRLPASQPVALGS